MSHSVSIFSYLELFVAGWIIWDLFMHVSQLVIQENDLDF